MALMHQPSSWQFAPQPHHWLRIRAGEIPRTAGRNNAQQSYVEPWLPVHYFFCCCYKTMAEVTYRRKSLLWASSSRGMTAHHHHTGKHGSRPQAWWQEQLSDDSLEPQTGNRESKLEMEVFRLSSPRPPVT